MVAEGRGASEAFLLQLFPQIDLECIKTVASTYGLDVEVVVKALLKRRWTLRERMMFFLRSPCSDFIT